MLLQYEESQAKEPRDIPPVLQTVVGDLSNSRCTICGVRDHWEAAEDALRELLDHRTLRYNFQV